MRTSPVGSDKGNHWAEAAAAAYVFAALMPTALILWKTFPLSAMATLSIVLTALVFARLCDRIAHRRRMTRASALAYRDELTGLPNRRHYIEQLNQAVGRGVREDSLAVLFVDLDRFKLVNDTLGHPAGDRFLLEVSNRLRRCARDSDVLARFGGDEFTFLLHDLHSTSEALDVASRILDSMNEPITIDGEDVWANASIGIALPGLERVTADDLLRQADVALYEAKRRGKGQYVLFESRMPMPSAALLSMEAQLRIALRRHQFELHYQPMVDIRTLQVVGLEALIRWRHPRLGLLQPKDFVAMAEETGMIRTLGEWIIEEACHQARTWQALYGRTFNISINLSALQFRHLDFLTDFSHMLRTTGLQRDSIQIEVTETMLMEDEEATKRNIGELRRLGVQVAIDDFGIGYSSLSYLKDFEVDVLKIDQSFVQDSAEDRSFSIAKAVVDLGHSLGMQVIAEGIETPAQLERMRLAGCDLGQGFLLGRPLDEHGTNELLAAGALMPQMLTDRSRRIA